MKILGLLSFGVVGGLAAACATTDSAVGSASVTAASVMGTYDAAARIGLERCRRELSCDNIGPDRVWSDMATCRRHVARETLAYFDSESCNSGIDVYPLAACIERIRNASCDDEGAAVPRLPECRTDRLCR